MFILIYRIWLGGRCLKNGDTYQMAASARNDNLAVVEANSTPTAPDQIDVELQSFNTDCAKCNRIIVAREAEEPALPILARMRVISHECCRIDLREIAIENHRAVQFNFDG